MDVDKVLRKLSAEATGTLEPPPDLWKNIKAGILVRKRQRGAGVLCIKLFMQPAWQKVVLSAGFLLLMGVLVVGFSPRARAWISEKIPFIYFNINVNSDIPGVSDEQILKMVLPHYDEMPEHILHVYPEYLPYPVENVTPGPIRVGDKIVGMRIMSGSLSAQDRVLMSEHYRIFYQVVELEYAGSVDEIWRRKVLDTFIEHKEVSVITLEGIDYTFTTGTDEAGELHIGVDWQKGDFVLSLYGINVPLEEIKKVITSF